MAGTLSVEALAVINELPGGELNKRPNIVSNYARQVAASHLTVYPPDDDTVITQAWMFSGGGTNANPSVFTIGAGLTMSINTSGATAILATNPASTAISTHTTRGAVRRLLASLGVAFTA